MNRKIFGKIKNVDNDFIELDICLGNTLFLNLSKYLKIDPLFFFEPMAK